MVPDHEAEGKHHGKPDQHFHRTGDRRTQRDHDSATRDPAARLLALELQPGVRQSDVLNGIQHAQQVRIEPDIDKAGSLLEEEKARLARDQIARALG